MEINKNNTQCELINTNLKILYTKSILIATGIPEKDVKNKCLPGLNEYLERWNGKRKELLKKET